MTLQEFFRFCDFDKMKLWLTKLDSKNTTESYRKAWKEICKTKIWDKERRIKEGMEYDNSDLYLDCEVYPDWCDVSSNQPWPTHVWAGFLEGSIWAEVLGCPFNIYDDRLRQLSNEEIGATMLWHLTFYTFTQKRRRTEVHIRKGKKLIPYP